MFCSTCGADASYFKRVYGNCSYSCDVCERGVNCRFLGEPENMAIDDHKKAAELRNNNKQLFENYKIKQEKRKEEDLKLQIRRLKEELAYKERSLKCLQEKREAILGGATKDDKIIRV